MQQEPIDGARPDGARARGSHGASRWGESGSLVTEYGLLAVLAATVAGVAINFATSGAILDLFNDLLAQARDIVGA